MPDHAGLFALFGMAAVMSGTMRVPLTATLFAVELTGSMPPLLPLLAACAAAYAVTGLLMKRSILTEKVARRGLHVLQEYGLDPFATMRVGEVMIRNVETLNGADLVADTVAAFASGRRRHRAYPVTDAEGRCLGIVGRSDILRWSRGDAEDGANLAEILADRELFHAAPEELVSDLADRMAAEDYSRVPVVDQESRCLLGLMTRKNLLAARGRMLREERERTRHF